MKALNLGCGSRKIPSKDDLEVINVDMEASVEPDIVANFVEKTPFEDGEFDEVYLFHTIEHIQKRLHVFAFAEIRRVLKHGGIFYMSYPEFSIICRYWLDNYRGQRDFWEKTIYGRQLFPSDYHVCAADSIELSTLLEECGFKDIEFKSEQKYGYNTVLKAVACDMPTTRERLVFDEVINTK